MVSNQKDKQNAKKDELQILEYYRVPELDKVKEIIYGSGKEDIGNFGDSSKLSIYEIDQIIPPAGYHKNLTSNSIKSKRDQKWTEKENKGEYGERKKKKGKLKKAEK